MKKQIFTVARRILGYSLVLSGMASAAYAITPPHMPEMDAGSAASALTLLIGGAMLLKDRIRLK